MNPINKNKAGTAFGAFLGLFHVVWALLVAFGLAQGYINWIFELHFIAPPYVIGEFALGTAIMLVIVTAVFGYIFGWVMAWLWNWAHRSSHMG